MAEEETHVGVEMRVRPDEQDDEQVPQHCDQVNPQEQGKNTLCCSGCMGSPRRMNLDSLLWFSLLMLLLSLLGVKRNGKSLEFRSTEQSSYQVVACFFD